MTKSTHEGYLMIDHRESPGISQELEAAAGLPPGAGRGVFESATYTCNHCNFVVVINPLRTRARGYCVKCDHYVCDACEAARVITGVCRTMQQIIEETQEAAVKQQH